jgi:hypothetical protein
MITCGTAVVPAGIAQSAQHVTGQKVRGSNPEGDIVLTRRVSAQPPAQMVLSLFPGVLAAGVYP